MHPTRRTLALALPAPVAALTGAAPAVPASVPAAATGTQKENPS
ncbi:hypothetical protein [Streptomyces sp. NBC_01276]